MPTISVFEHDTLLIRQIVGGVEFKQRHYESLAARLGKKDDSVFPFYSLVKDGVKFKQYVGAIQAGDLTIEILPKTDRDNANQDWKAILLFMLSKVYSLRVSSESITPQHIRKSTVLDLFISRYLNEIERIIHQGLVKTYRTQRENATALKGRLLIQQQITKNLVHQERFYVQHTVYDQSHIMNRILRQALVCIVENSSNPAFLQRAGNYLECFPDLDPIPINEDLFARLVYDRKTDRYRNAIALAELILFNNMPDLQSGRKDSLAMLFDMNRLWEEFIYVTLRHYFAGRYTVSKQVQKRFWEKKIIRPDIVIRDSSKMVVLDTKWKRPDKGYPSDNDLHQMYVYYRYFGANKVALLYPSTNDSSQIFHGTFTESGTSCDLMFFPVPDWQGNGKKWQTDIGDAIDKWI